MNIAFITDLHLDVTYEFPFGIDTQKNFQRVLGACKKLKPDLLVIGGDICYRSPEKEIYEWAMAELNQLPFPYECISGNHDNSEWLAMSMEKEALLRKQEYFFAKKLEQQLCIFLDTSQKQISTEQFNWLSRQLYQDKSEACIFMHHPPMSSAVPYMDNRHGFSGGEALMELLFEHQKPISIFTGHYHVEKTVIMNNVSLFITPSCFFQVNQYQEDFKVDHHRIAYRMINLEKGKIATTVHYLAGSRS